VNRFPFRVLTAALNRAQNVAARDTRATTLQSSFVSSKSSNILRLRPSMSSMTASTKFSLSAFVFDESLYARLSKSATTSVLAVKKFVIRLIGFAATVAA
jgi:hypothetical protein